MKHPVMSPARMDRVCLSARFRHTAFTCLSGFLHSYSLYVYQQLGSFLVCHSVINGVKVLDCYVCRSLKGILVGLNAFATSSRAPMATLVSKCIGFQLPLP